MPNIFYGDADNNYIVSANGEDVIYGYGGIDYLYGRGGTDQLFGGVGEDSLFGEDGMDMLDGGEDNDQLDGGFGNDTLTGGAGDDTFIVNDDTDTVTDLGFGTDALAVGPGATANATVVAAWTATDATMNDGIANLVTAGFAVDLRLAVGGMGFSVTNTGGVTTLMGSAQDDTLTSGTGADTLIGGLGDDTIISEGRTATAVYSGVAADYSVTKIGGVTWQVVDLNSEDGDTGTDTLIGVPTVQFADVTVDLPINQAPTLAAAIANQTIDEDTALSFQLSAGTFSDPDGDPLDLTATLADGSPLPDWLSFDGETRTFSGTPPLEYSGKISLKVTATDGEFSVTDDFTLTVTAVDDTPIITSGGGGATANYTVLENTTSVTTVTATDADIGSTQRYSIVGGADAALFRISSTTGAIGFISAPSFENRADANGNGVYDVIVRVSDGSLTDEQTLSVTVSDVLNEVLRGTVADNTLTGSTGADRLYGFGGQDTLNGGDGNDRLYGDLGNDTLVGGNGDDQLFGGADQDRLSGSSGNDVLFGDTGNDILTGDIGNDRLFGGADQDRLSGGTGSDRLYGDDGSDVLTGDDGNDLIFGGADMDRLFGGSANDRLYGDDGRDVLVGGDGNDQLYGGVGQDVLTGGSGRDWFVFDFSPSDPGNADAVTDFTRSQGDKIVLSRSDFTGFTSLGAITADQFHAGAGATQAQDANDRLVYNTSNGALYYDEDGLGGADSVLVASINSFATTTFGYGEILIIA